MCVLCFYCRFTQCSALEGKSIQVYTGVSVDRGTIHEKKRMTSLKIEKNSNLTRSPMSVDITRVSKHDPCQEHWRMTNYHFLHWPDTTARVRWHRTCQEACNLRLWTMAWHGQPCQVDEIEIFWKIWKFLWAQQPNYPLTTHYPPISIPQNQIFTTHHSFSLIFSSSSHFFTQIFFNLH